ncbi:hypothetical protein [Allorhizocola rhizosphaerae]|uniref:hypothetical protein n=1 Tax=Allorhizocola rhizosphaerae TaxID=1872709 RepID=UPI0013C37245|nr:hypothetical protein [Allorhizocola rhizosphaerae]
MAQGNQASTPEPDRSHPLYRASVWWMRTLPVPIVLGCCDMERWPVVLGWIGLGLAISLPLRYIAAFRWHMPMHQLDKGVLFDAYSWIFRY